MKLVSLFKKVPNLIPTKEKLEQMKEWSVQRRAMYWGARIVVILTVGYLTYKGSVSEESLINLIEELF